MLDKLISGSESINWVREIAQGNLHGVVKKVEIGNHEYCRIDLKNRPTDNLSGVAALIEQLYDEKVYKFDLAGFNCNEKVLDKLFERIRRKVNEIKNSRYIDFNINVDPTIESAVQAYISNVEDSFEGSLYFSLSKSVVSSGIADCDRLNSGFCSTSIAGAMDSQSTTNAQQLTNRSDPNLNEVVVIHADGRHQVFAPKGNRKGLNFGRYAFDSALNAFEQRVQSCGLMPSIALLKAGESLYVFETMLRSKNIEYLHISNTIISFPRSVVVLNFMQAFMQMEFISTLIFDNFIISENEFKSLALPTYDHLTTLEFRFVIEGRKWTETLPHLLKKCRSLVVFECSSHATVNSFSFLDTIITTAPSLAELRLPGLSFEINVLVEWLTQSRDFHGMKREELSIVLNLGSTRLDDENIKLLEEVMDGFNEAGKDFVQIEVTLSQKKRKLSSSIVVD